MRTVCLSMSSHTLFNQPLCVRCFVNPYLLCAQLCEASFHALSQIINVSISFSSFRRRLFWILFRGLSLFNSKKTSKKKGSTTTEALKMPSPLSHAMKNNANYFRWKLYKTRFCLRWFAIHIACDLRERKIECLVYVIRSTFSRV